MQIFHRATLTYTVMLFVLTTSIPGVHAQSHPGPRYAGCMEARELHLRNCTRNVEGIRNETTRKIRGEECSDTYIREFHECTPYY